MDFSVSAAFNFTVAVAQAHASDESREAWAEMSARFRMVSVSSEAMAPEEMRWVLRETRDEVERDESPVAFAVDSVWRTIASETEAEFRPTELAESRTRLHMVSAMELRDGFKGAVLFTTGIEAVETEGVGAETEEAAVETNGSDVEPSGIGLADDPSSHLD